MSSHIKCFMGALTDLLRELEIATFDAAQIEGAEENASAALEGIRAVVRDLARSTGNAV